jgi:DNA-binding transcriptional MerR regulator
MEFEVADLASAAGVSVDTIRFYQTGGLLPLPGRSGRKAVYTDEHLDRLRLIRSMASKGLSLKAIRLLLERECEAPGTSAPRSDTALLAALEEEADGATYTGDELAAALGVPGTLIRSVEAAGLAEGLEDAQGRSRYGDGDLAAARGALRLLGYGFPLASLLALAVRHDRAVRKTCDAAIDLFDDHVRKKQGRSAAVARDARSSGLRDARSSGLRDARSSGLRDARSDGAARAQDADPENGEEVAAAFRELLPVVTAIVAHHFQRVLVGRALKRLRRKGDSSTLSFALKVASRTKLKVSWR